MRVRRMWRPLAGMLCIGLSASFAQTPICEVQGNGATSPFQGQTVQVEGIITAVHVGSGTLGGFFLEEPECDTDPATSNGIFIFAPTATSLTVGQRVRVAGTVVEYFGLTEMTNTSITPLGTTGSVTPTDIILPLATSQWERYEGMLLHFPGTLTITDTRDWAQYGEVVLSPERLIQPTNYIDPNDAVPSGTTTSGAGNAEAVITGFTTNARSSIRLDDGFTTPFPTNLPFLGPEGTLRTGSTITDLRAVLTYTFNEYRLEPAGVIEVQHALRPAVPMIGDGLRAASLNVLNYWTTLDEWGAANAAELDRQRTKLLAALTALDADVLALHELENNDVAWADLLAALNNLLGDNIYAALEVDAFGNGGTKSVIFYRTAVLEPVTPLYVINTGLFQRPHLTQGFLVNATGGRFLFSTAHMRSKQCDNATGGNTDQNDGQGCYNAMRRSQATALVEHWAELRSSSGIQAQLLMGDFNAYTEEDPMDVLRASGLQRSLAPESYTFNFEGAFGALDHAWATEAMAASISGAAVWQINSEEPVGLGYSDANLARYQPNAFRCSDHDPVLVGISPALLPVAVPTLTVQSDVDFQLQGERAQWTCNSCRSSAGMLTVHDARGKLVLTPGVVGPTTVVQDVSALPAGIYLWRIQGTEHYSVAGRFVCP